MELRLGELEKEINNILDLISSFLNENGYQFDIKEIIDDYEGVPNEFELKTNPNKRRTASIAKYSSSDKKILYSTLSSQMIWYIAWLAYLIKGNQLDKFDKDDFIGRLIRIDRGDVTDLSCRDLYEWNNKDLDSIFLYAMSFLICHEIGHAVYQHPGYYDEKFNLRDIELLKRNELEADSFAANCIKHISSNNDHEKELAVYGLIVAQIAILFIRNKEVTYDTHPDPDKRLENVLNGIDKTVQMECLINYAKDLAEIYIQRRFV